MVLFVDCNHCWRAAVGVAGRHAEMHTVPARLELHACHCRHLQRSFWAVYHARCNRVAISVFVCDDSCLMQAMAAIDEDSTLTQLSTAWVNLYLVRDLLLYSCSGRKSSLLSRLVCSGRIRCSLHVSQLLSASCLPVAWCRRNKVSLPAPQICLNAALLYICLVCLTTKVWHPVSLT